MFVCVVMHLSCDIVQSDNMQLPSVAALQCSGQSMKLSNGSSLSDMVQSYLSSETEIEGLHRVLLYFIH